MITPTFEYERQYWQQGIKLIAGIDEAGMGAWAGPVVAAAVVFRNNDQFPMTNDHSSPNDQMTTGQKIIIRDSKLMSAKQREKAAEWIKENALAWAVREASVEEISKLNIRGAAQLAMRRAVDALRKRPELLLIDGTEAQIHEEIPAVCLVDGDALCFSIAAASIIAKAYRDKLMTELDKEFPGYSFAKHKGYGSREHLISLSTLGPCVCHRPTYSPITRLLNKGAVGERLLTR